MRHVFRVFTIFGLAYGLTTMSLPLPSSGQSKAQSPQEWGVVLGADKTEAAANHEVSQDNRILGKKPRIYLCNGWYRTIAAYQSKGDALRALQRVLDAGSKRSLYIVAIKQWCPSKKLIGAS